MANTHEEAAGAQPQTGEWKAVTLLGGGRYRSSAAAITARALLQADTWGWLEAVWHLCLQQQTATFPQ